MRITGGAARGIALKTPRGAALRPATDQLREAVFSSLGGERVAGARVLDLFAGTGAYGLEAASRGAAAVTFVENKAAHLKLCRDNAAAVLKAIGGVAVPELTFRGGDAARRAVEPGTMRLVFLDPPYEEWERRGADLLAAAAEALEGGGEARLIAEAPGESALQRHAAGLELLRRLGRGRGQPAAFVFGRP